MPRVKPRSFRLLTFGCKANQYDAQVLREALVRRGWREEPGGGDLVVVNTCTVTAEAGRKARQLLRRIARERPDARLAVTGCLAESEPEALRSLPGVEWVIGGPPGEPEGLLSHLGCKPGGEEPAGIEAFAGHTRAFLKIQDGCDLACAYCIVPSVRGPSRSRPAGEIAAELERLVRGGHCEVVLCGIHIGHWGLERGERLSELLESLASRAIADREGRRIDWRLRLSSIEATEVDGGVLEALVRHPRRIAPHLHMPLQSGDDRVLASMGRWYSAGDYLAACERIQAALDRPALTADAMVGFPGETEEAFERTLGACRAAGLARLHVFSFSSRPGTRAEGLAAPPPEAVRARRGRLVELARELGRAYRRSLVGARETLVHEGEVGLSGRYQRVRVPGGLPAGPSAPLVDVSIEAAPGEGDGELLGRPIEVPAAAGRGGAG